LIELACLAAFLQKFLFFKLLPYAKENSIKKDRSVWSSLFQK
jgi:hypothetical protein